MADFLLHLPTWGMIRLFGILAYLMLFAGVFLGILYGFPVWKGSDKPALFRWHTFFTNTGTLFALLHSVILIIDTFKPFTWAQVLIPFAADYQPVVNGLGTIVLYGLLILIFTSDIRNRLKQPIWHGIHLLAYPLFLFAAIHGFILGTDSKFKAVQFMYLFTLATVAVFTLFRFLLRSEERSH